MPLLHTKLYVPGSHGRDAPLKYVSRPRLIQKLSAGLARRLTLICAPAGFGKSTLLGEWIHQTAQGGGEVDGTVRPAYSVAWLSLDDGDNDPMRFWTYFVAALQTLDADLGQSSIDLLQAPQPLIP